MAVRTILIYPDPILATQSEPIDELLTKLHRQLNAEVLIQREMFAVRGLIETCTAGVGR